MILLPWYIQQIWQKENADLNNLGHFQTNGIYIVSVLLTLTT